MNDWKLFGQQIPTVPVPANAIKPMYAAYGRKPEHTCGQCKHLIATWSHTKTFYKCELARISASEATDFRKKWMACGKFEEDK